MTSKKIAIRCLTKPSKGFGHFSRCLNVANSLKRNKIQVSFIIDYNKYVITKLKKLKFSFIVVPKHFSQSSEFEFTRDYLQKHRSDALIIDMREFGENLSKFLYEHNFKTILFDDAWCKNVYADLLFNGTNVAQYHNYEIINPNSKQFLGPKFWILNDKFIHYRKKSISIKKKRQYTIVISLGGSDADNLTSHVVKSISKLENLNAYVIVGPFFSKYKRLKQFIKSGNSVNIKLITHSNEIWKSFSLADIAISNGGNTLFELACLGIPTLCIPSVKHEIKYTESFALHNFSKNLGLRQKNPTKINNAILELLNDHKLQKTMCVSGKKIVDGKGLSRVLKIILKLVS